MTAESIMVEVQAYAKIVGEARRLSAGDRNRSREERMQAAVDLIWSELGGKGVSWVGFYLPAPERDELVLGARRDKPACSPIGLHGVCGRAFRERRPIVVADVRELGEAYIACDPADRSEVALPLLEADGAPWAVLDLDSHRPGFFTAADALGLEQVLAAFRLTPSSISP